MDSVWLDGKAEIMRIYIFVFVIICERWTLRGVTDSIFAQHVQGRDSIPYSEAEKLINQIISK